MKKSFTISIAIGLSLVLFAVPLLAVGSMPKRVSPTYISPGRKPVRVAKRDNLTKPSKSSKLKNLAAIQMPTVAPGQSATLLPDGSWLLVGGEGDLRAAVAIRDQRTGLNSGLNVKPHHPRSWHSATMLPNGTVLILGGLGADGKAVEAVEVFDPATRSFEVLPSTGLTPRTFHSATLLTDGRVLIAGGIDRMKEPVREVVLWQPQDRTSSVLAQKLQTGRQKHQATLLSSGDVLLWGGTDERGLKLDDGEVYYTETESLAWTGARDEQSRGGTPSLVFSSPKDGAADVPVETRISLRFSQPLDAETVSAATLTLSNRQGELAAKIVPAEGGRLAFVIPAEPLLSDSTYNLMLSGASNANGLSLIPTTVTFTTVSTNKNVEVPAPQQTTPDTINSPEHGRGEHPHPGADSSQSASAETALTGQVMAQGGQPLASVTLQIGDQQTKTDQTGRFSLASLTQGKHSLIIYGNTAIDSRAGHTYGTFEVLVDIKGGKTNVLPYTIWLPLLDEQNAARLPTPTRSEFIVRTPRVPGMEVRLPANSVLRMPHGHGMKMAGADGHQPLTSLAITPIPVERPPFPMPAGISEGFVFTLQLHGARVEGPNGEKRAGMRFIFPNVQNLAPGARVDFWNYESSGAGWYMYGQGTVTADGRQVIPDPGVALQSMHCLSLMNKSGAPADGPAAGNGAQDGDPVDLGTGLFVYEKTDLVLPDVFTVPLTRTYRQNDSVERAFGKGATHPYEMFIQGDTYNYGEMILPDGGRIRFNRNASGVYEHTATPTHFYKATMRQISSGIGYDGGWEVKLRDGTIYQFYKKTLQGNIFGIQSSTTGLNAILDRNGNRLTITRDGNLRATKITSPNGRWLELGYSDASKRVTQAKDNIGRIVTYTYDAAGRLWKVTDTGGGVTEYTYDAADRMLSIKDARSIVFLTNEYDAYGRVKKQIQPDGTTYQFAYTPDANNKVTQTDVTDPRGNLRRVTFNTGGYWLTDTSALGQPEQQTISCERQAVTNLVTSTTDPLSRRTEYIYDAVGNVARITRMAGTSEAAEVNFTYEPRFGQVASVTDPLGHTSAFAYNGRGNLVSMTSALGHKVKFSYNAAGQLAFVTDALGNTTQYNYAQGELAEVIDPLGRSAKRFVDGAGRPTRTTNELGQSARYEYNSANQPVRTINQLEGATALSYDLNGNILSVTDARQGATSYTYDSMDRVVTRRDPLLREETFEYEAARLKRVADRKGQITNFTYDALDRLKQVTYSDASTVVYTYDAGNRLTQIADSLSGTITYAYDNFDGLTTETTPQGIISYTYDATGRRTSMTVAGQPTVNYTYDNADRLTQIVQGSATVSIGYDAAGRRTSLTLPNGMATEYGYDPASQLTSLTYKRNSTVLGNLTYEYDKAGRRTRMGGSYARTLSPQSLTSASYNAANQQTGLGNQSLAYDLNGNLISDGVNTYTWNARDQLVSISGSVNASFQYDASGRRSSKTINGSTTNYLYDGSNIVQELNATTPLANLLNGGLDEVFSRVDSSGTWNLMTDGRGSTLALGDSTGTVQSQYSYDAFGMTTTSGASNGNASQYTGRENDQTGLYYYRNKYYSSNSQRFISEGFGLGGGPNAYAYAGNDPVNCADPGGMQVQSLAESTLDPGNIPGAINYVGTSSLWDGLNRLLYSRGSAALKNSGDALTASLGRVGLQDKAYSRASPLGQAITELEREARSLRGPALGLERTAASATRTNPFVNRMGGIFRIGGGTLMGVGIGISIYNIATAGRGCRARVAAQEGGGWAGSLAYGAAGAKTGAVIGTAIGGPIGGIIGSLIGGIGGGLYGYSQGRNAGAFYYDLF